MKDLIQYNEFRQKMNERITNCGHLGLKRFWALDSRAYEPGKLDEKTLEYMGLTTSMVLKCDDCVTYHIIRLIQLGASDDEFYEALNVSLIVGGSITVPHIRRAFETIDACREMQKMDPELKALL
ncbi:carboxymuconolactone decarboxylase family protein [Candidatus Bathyarchaeota archaeon]|jgi:AhpD family alkylhydroperoxidase|nr:MAG: carboxymuconolactone decarboxylase family protein [Candidatus Bathyarchaeota archaeon]